MVHSILVHIFGYGFHNMEGFLSLSLDEVIKRMAYDIKNVFLV